MLPRPRKIRTKPVDSTPPTLPTKGRLLCIDHGEKVIGIALSDAAWISARPLELIYRTTRAAEFERIKALIAEHSVHAVIVGMPENPALPEEIPDGAEPNHANAVRRWTTRLAAALIVPVYWWEEQFSSMEAERLIHESGIAYNPREERLDDKAAAVILQTFMNAMADGFPMPPPVKNRTETPSA